jgi:hypothetical protein
MSRLALFLLGLLTLLVALLMILGLIISTNLVFGNKTYESLSSRDRNLGKIFIVLTWVQIILSIIIALFELVS